MMVAIAFSVSGHMNDLRFVGAEVEAARQSPGERLAIVEHSFEGDGTGNWSVVEKDGDAAPILQRHLVRMVGIDRSVGRLYPASAGAVESGESRLHGALRALAHSGALMRRQNGEEDAILRHRVQSLGINRCFCQPHPFGRAPEAMLKVGDAPADLGDTVPGNG